MLNKWMREQDPHTLHKYAVLTAGAGAGCVVLQVVTGAVLLWGITNIFLWIALFWSMSAWELTWSRITEVEEIEIEKEVSCDEPDDGSAN